MELHTAGILIPSPAHLFFFFALALGQEGAAGATVGDGPVTEKFQWQLRRLWRWWRIGSDSRRVRRERGRRLLWRGRRSQTEDIAAGALVFGLAGPLQPVGVELGV